jgi:Ca2+-transporting ATPase
MKNMNVVEEPSPTSSGMSGSLTSRALSNKLLIDDAASMDSDQIQQAFKTDAAQGLTAKEADARRKQVGANEIRDDDEETLFSKFLEKFKEPMILLLLGSALVSLLVKQFDDAASITLAVIIVCTVAFIQEYRSDEALERLKSLTNHKANVHREGVLSEVNATELVPGDLVQLTIGDRVPADIRIIDAVRLGIEEAIFTGEPNPAHKTAKELTARTPATPIAVDEQKFPKAVHVHELKVFYFQLMANSFRILHLWEH